MLKLKNISEKWSQLAWFMSLNSSVVVIGIAMCKGWRESVCTRTERFYQILFHDAQSCLPVNLMHRPVIEFIIVHARHLLHLLVGRDSFSMSFVNVWLMSTIRVSTLVSVSNSSDSRIIREQCGQSRSTRGLQRIRNNGQQTLLAQKGIGVSKGLSVRLRPVSSNLMIVSPPNYGLCSINCWYEVTQSGMTRKFWR